MRQTPSPLPSPHRLQARFSPGDGLDVRRQLQLRELMHVLVDQLPHLGRPDELTDLVRAQVVQPGGTSGVNGSRRVTVGVTGKVTVRVTGRSRSHGKGYWVPTPSAHALRAATSSRCERRDSRLETVDR